LSCANPERLQQICDGLPAEKIDLPSTGADRKAGYDSSILQAELSLTQVLDHPAHGLVRRKARGLDARTAARAIPAPPANAARHSASGG
jgi:hypothetical protein